MDKLLTWFYWRTGKSSGARQPELLNTKASISPGSPLIDSYPESNQSAGGNVYNGSVTAYYGQSFRPTSAYTLGSCKFYLKKSGSPTGNVTMKLYAHTGTFSTNGKPTGPALATSDPFDVSTLTTSYQLITFTFTSRTALSVSTPYVLILDGSSIGNGSNYVIVGADSSSPTASGNQSYSANGSSWTGDNSFEVCFYVYGYSDPETVPFKGKLGHQHRIQMTVSGTVGTVTMRVGNGQTYTYNAGASVSELVYFLGGASLVKVTPSSDFNGTISDFSVYKTNGV